MKPQQEPEGRQAPSAVISTSKAMIVITNYSKSFCPHSAALISQRLLPPPPAPTLSPLTLPASSLINHSGGREHRWVLGSSLGSPCPQPLPNPAHPPETPAPCPTHTHTQHTHNTQQCVALAVPLANPIAILQTGKHR